MSKWTDHWPSDVHKNGKTFSAASSNLISVVAKWCLQGLRLHESSHWTLNVNDIRAATNDYIYFD